jgi:hypothetical protein
MSPENELVIETGKALWGEQWQAPMARALEVHKDTVQDWKRDRFKPRPTVFAELFRLAAERQAELDDVVEKLRQVASRT